MLYNNSQSSLLLICSQGQSAVFLWFHPMIPCCITMSSNCILLCVCTDWVTRCGSDGQTWSVLNMKLQRQQVLTRPVKSGQVLVTTCPSVWAAWTPHSCSEQNLDPRHRERPGVGLTGLSRFEAELMCSEEVWAGESDWRETTTWKCFHHFDHRRDLPAAFRTFFGSFLHHVKLNLIHTLSKFRQKTAAVPGGFEVGWPASHIVMSSAFKWGFKMETRRWVKLQQRPCEVKRSAVFL